MNEAETGAEQIGVHFNGKQKDSLHFVLYPLLRLKYNNALADAVADLGAPEQIKETFVGFQKYLYPRQ